MSKAFETVNEAAGIVRIWAQKKQKILSLEVYF
jgi:hypothetical protein